MWFTNIVFHPLLLLQRTCVCHERLTAHHDVTSVDRRTRMFRKCVLNLKNLTVHLLSTQKSLFRTLQGLTFSSKSSFGFVLGFSWRISSFHSRDDLRMATKIFSAICSYMTFVSSCKSTCVINYELQLQVLSNSWLAAGLFTCCSCILWRRAARLRLIFKSRVAHVTRFMMPKHRASLTTHHS